MLNNYQTFISEATTYWQNSSIYSLFSSQINTDLNDLSTAYSNYNSGVIGLNSNFNAIIPSLQSYVLTKYNIYILDNPNLNIPELVNIDLSQLFNYFSQSFPSYTDFFSEINSTSLDDTVIQNLITSVNGYLTSDTNAIAGVKTTINSNLPSYVQNLGSLKSGSLSINFKNFLLNYMNGTLVFSTFNWTIPGVYS